MKKSHKVAVSDTESGGEPSTHVHPTSHETGHSSEHKPHHLTPGILAIFILLFLLAVGLWLLIANPLQADEGTITPVLPSTPTPSAPAGTQAI